MTCLFLKSIDGLLEVLIVASSILELIFVVSLDLMDLGCKVLAKSAL